MRSWVLSRSVRAIVLPAILGLGVIVAGSEAGAPHAAAAQRAAAGLPAPQSTSSTSLSTHPNPGSPTAVAPSSATSTQPNPGSAVSTHPGPGLPTTGGAPVPSPQPVWPLAVIGVLCAGAGMALRRLTRT